MAQITITLSPAQMQALNKARRDAGHETLEQHINAVVKDQGTDPRVIAKFAKANGKAKKDADAAAAVEQAKQKEAFRKAQRKAKDKASK